MARHAAQPRRVAIVHDPGHGMPAPHPRGRDTRPQTRRRPEHRLPQLQGTQHFTLGKDIERLAGGAPYDLPEQDGVQVTVGHSGAGRDLGAGGVDEAEGRRAVRGVAIEREGGPQPRRMRQEVPHGDAVPPRAAELADVGRHRRVEANLAAVHQHHQRRRRGQHLGQGGEVVQRALRVHRRTPRRPSEVAIPFREQRRVAPAHHERRPRIRTLPDTPLDQRIERPPVEPRRGWTHPGATPRGDRGPHLQQEGQP